MDESNAKNAFDRANALFRKGEYVQALSLLESLETSYPENANLLYARALCLERLDRRPEALDAVNRSIAAGVHDRAVILKARLITMPSDPVCPAETETTALPSFLSSSTQTTPKTEKRLEPPQGTDSRQVWIMGSTISIAALFVLLPIFVHTLAQAETAVAGALPTLFPMRLLCIGGTVMLLTEMNLLLLLDRIYADASPLHAKRLGLAAACGGLALAPIIGWLLAALLFFRNTETPMRSAAWFVLATVLLQCLGLAIVAITLGLTAPMDIFLEIKAGYG